MAIRSKLITSLLTVAKSVNEFLRLGSHINQQIVYYPAQMELIFPNELGIPVRLQTTSVSFTSIRGNLTTPATDIHIRYQGMSLVSLSTFGPLVQSEHAARIQKSIVTHLPIKFNISHTPIGVFNMMKYLEPKRLMLRAITMFVSPPSTSCGIIHLHNEAILNVNRGVKATFLIENLASIVEYFSGDKNVLKTSLLLKDYRQDTETSGEFLNFEMDFGIKNQDKNIVTRLEFNSSDVVRTFIENNDYLYLGDRHTALHSKHRSHITAGFYKPSENNNTQQEVLLLNVSVDTAKELTGEKRIDVRFSHEDNVVLDPFTRLILPFCSKDSEESGFKEMQVKIIFADTW
ncbi:unnamed protein product [Diatraea saccharalis]|uniref:Uncharacterized protein n=1 Tax=Diatraea saccharalis TaxID=40085 RepID=A0A9N9R499_9NEOP|nr:unnamed protein product [Diatraea saccharalis]